MGSTFRAWREKPPLARATSAVASEQPPSTTRQLRPRPWRRDLGGVRVRLLPPATRWETSVGLSEGRSSNKRTRLSASASVKRADIELAGVLARVGEEQHEFPGRVFVAPPFEPALPGSPVLGLQHERGLRAPDQSVLFRTSATAMAAPINPRLSVANSSCDSIASAIVAVGESQSSVGGCVSFVVSVNAWAPGSSLRVSVSAHPCDSRATPSAAS